MKLIQIQIHFGLIIKARGSSIPSKDQIVFKRSQTRMLMGCLNNEELILRQVQPMQGKVAHRTSWKIVKASVHVRISLISACLHLALDTGSFPSKKVCGSCSTARRLTVSRSANSTNWPSMIFLANLAGIGACPGPTMKAFSGLGPDAE